MNSNPAPTAPMRLQLTEPSVVQTEASPGVIRLLTERLELVEDLWQTVLRSECPPEQVERLLHLKELSGPVAPGLDPEASSAVDTDGIVAGDTLGVEYFTTPSGWQPLTSIDGGTLAGGLNGF